MYCNGAGSGIGRATAVRMASEGGCVAILDILEQAGKETADMISGKGGTATFIKCDVGIETDIVSAVHEIIANWQRVDVLVNDAAIMTFKKIVDLSSAEWDQVMNVNMRSVFLFCKYCIPHMKGGSVVNISSVHAHQTTPNVIPYASSKGAMEAFTRGASQEYCGFPGSV